jgi:CheY-like chemotaxis protein
MPVMDGLEATRQIRTLDGWSDRPILAMTANAFDEDKLACQRAGLNDFIGKPFKPEDLFRTICKWLPSTEVPRTAAGAWAGEQIHPDVPRLSVQPVVATTVKPDETLTRLAKIHGLNIDEGLSMLNGKVDKYLELLMEFVQSHCEDMAKLQQCLDEGQRTQAHHISHTLKGVSGVLSFGAMTEQAMQIDRLLRSSEAVTTADIAAEMQMIRQQFAELRKALYDSSDPPAVK